MKKAGKLYYVRIKGHVRCSLCRRVFKFPQEDEHHSDERTRSPEFLLSILRKLLYTTAEKVNYRKTIIVLRVLTLESLDKGIAD